MTDEKLKRIRELCDEATPGFVAEHDRMSAFFPEDWKLSLPDNRTPRIWHLRRADAKLFAVARPALSALLDEVERQRIESEMPCYLCAIPGKDERARTSVCASCGQKFHAEAERLRTALVDIVAKIGGRPGEGPLEDEYARFAMMRAHKALSE